MTTERKTVDERRAEFLERSVPISARGIVARAFSGDGSRANAIRAKCLDCCCYDRAEVAGCTVVVCPLHPFRPYQGKDREAATDPENEAGIETTGAGGIPTPSDPVQTIPEAAEAIPGP